MPKSNRIRSCVLGLFLAILEFMPLQAIAQQCEWYAGNDIDTVYNRADAACRGYIIKNGWNPPGYVYDSTKFWIESYPAAGAQCFLTYKPSEYPNNQPTNLYNASLKTGCVDAGLCATHPQNSAFGCGKTVSDLQNITKTADDPTRIFHQTQTCIAQKACDLRCDMDNCKWMDKVIPDFVYPYLQKAGDWPDIEQACGERGTGWWSDRRCAEAMARNHIFDDLLPALTRHGCGSERDWHIVYEAIEECSGASLSNRAEQIMSSGIVWIYRNRVRAACQRSRTTNQLPIDANTNLKGLTCDQH